MALQSGSRLGHFEILSLAGAGGMGEVYRARDTRLGRDVAIKVLPARFASEPEFRQRLEREARAVSSLSHPNICALYDVGHQDGVDFLVMEYLEGETLAARLARGALPPDQLLRYGVDITDGLAAAHRRGLVHRDLKPGNIMLSRTGARLLDFGLAKPEAAIAASALGEATVTAPITSEGAVLGTFQYMSPEQVEGRAADARSDIFALGTVLYEMATGRRAFDGKTPASVIAAVLEREPPAVSTLQPLVPAAVDDVVRGCLAKDPDERWQTAHDVKLQLQALRTRVSAPAPAEVRARRVWTGYVPWAIAALAIAAAAALVAGDSRREERTASMPMVRAALLPPAAHSFTPNDFAISPDGRRVAFVAAGADGVSTVWVRSLESGQDAEIAGSDGASSPFWSPDSRWIGFFARAKLLKVEPGGVGVQAISDVNPTARSGTWSQHGDILFAGAVFGSILRVNENGGAPTAVTTILDEMPGEAHRFPQFLPDGRRFIYFATWTHKPRMGLYMGSVEGGTATLVSSTIRTRTLFVGGQLLYVEADTVFAQPFDLTEGRLMGDRRPVLRSDLAWDWRFGDMPLSASNNGTLVYQSPHTYRSQLVWFDRNGKELEAVGAPGFSSPQIARDGRRVAVTHDSKRNGQPGIWIYDLQRNISTQLTADGIETAHAWSPDGRSIAYSSLRPVNALYRRAADGSGPEEKLLESPGHLLVNSYSPDGRTLLYMDFRGRAPQLVALDLASQRSTLLDAGAEAAYSPDGKWVAYLWYSRGTLVLRPVDRPARVQFSSGPGSQPRWRRDMTEVFYIAPDKKLMAVPLTMRGGMLEPGTPVPLFQTRIVQPRLILFQYDVSPDGQRFLINSLPREDTAAPLSLLVNWRAQPAQ
jgi:Tol biopolymer transport system component